MKKIKRPKHYEYFLVKRETDRVCSHDGCEEPARNVRGYYLVGARRVRVWACDGHRVGNPNTRLPAPPSIVAAEEAEAEYRKRQEKRLKYSVEPERGTSIKYMEPTGHGPRVPYDRVASWRWNGY